MQCPACDADNPESGKFCGQCGARLPVACPGCGTENPPANKFCGECGTTLDGATAEASAAPAPVSAPGSAPAATEPAVESAAERRQLTVMFCDLADSTALSERLDPEDLRDVIGLYQDLCGRQIDAYGGYIARYMGDGILVYFGYPQAHEDDPERAIHAALQIVDAVTAAEPRPGLSLHVRIGIATGLVVAGDIIGEGASEERAVLGVTPNLAARLQGLATPDSVVIGDRTRQIAGAFFDYEDLGENDLKGISEPQRAWRVTGESAATSRFEASAADGLTPLVGREEEIALLLNRWRQALDRDGQVAMLKGEAGVGKSRIIEGFRDGVGDQDHGIITVSCSPFRTNSAFYPIVACLERVLGFDPTDPVAVRQQKVDAFVAQAGLAVDDVVPHLEPILFEAGDRRHVLPDSSPGERRSLISEALLLLLEAESRRRPMVFIVEDGHWVDPSSDEFLTLLVDRAQTLRLMVLVSARPGYDPAWVDEPHVTVLALNRLSRADSLALVTEVAGGKAMPDEVIDRIVANADGIPLFVEELTKTILESGLVVDAGDHYALTGPLPPLAIPDSLHDSLMARLDHLAPVKEVAQLAAVLGRSFDRDLLAAVSPLAAGDLDAALDKLVEAGLLHRRVTPHGTSCEFKHALVQEAAYESLLNATRQGYHADVAGALETDFSAVVAAEPELVAHHFSEAGLAEKAVPFWRHAARRATEHWASAEAVGHVRRGLGLISSIPDDGGRVDQEIPMLFDLVAGLRILDRYDEALKALDQAETTATRHDRVADLSLVHFYRGNIYFPMGNIDGCLKEHEQARTVARAAGSPEMEARALGGIGDAYYMRGQMTAAYEHFDACVRLSRDNGLTAIETANLPMRGHAQLYLNRLDDGLADSLQAVELAAAGGNDRAEMVARGSCAGKFFFDKDDLDGAQDQCGRALDLARRLGARRFEPINQMVLAKVAAMKGDRAGAIAIAEQAVATARETGVRFAGPMALGALAVVTDDQRVRDEALTEGEEILAGQCVSHNHLWFYRDAMDACLDAGDWARTRHFADAAEAFIGAEALPWLSLLVERARALAVAGEDGMGPVVRGRLESVRQATIDAGLALMVKAVDGALAD